MRNNIYVITPKEEKFNLEYKYNYIFIRHSCNDNYFNDKNQIKPIYRSYDDLGITDLKYSQKLYIVREYVGNICEFVKN